MSNLQVNTNFPRLTVSFPAQWKVATLNRLDSIREEKLDLFKDSPEVLEMFELLRQQANSTPQLLLGWLSSFLPLKEDPSTLAGFVGATIAIVTLQEPGDIFVPTEILNLNEVHVRRLSEVEIGNINNLELDYFRIQYQFELAPEIEIYVDARTPNIFLKDEFEKLFDQIVSTIALTD
jgi:hypothetical protein